MPVLLRRDHPGLARVVEQPARIHHGANVAQRFELIHLAGGLHGHAGFVEVHGHDVAGLEDVAEAVGTFAGIQFAGGDAVAEEDARETFRENDLTIGRTMAMGACSRELPQPKLRPATTIGYSLSSWPSLT